MRRHIERDRARLIKEAFGPQEVEEFFPLDFQARFPAHIWKDFFTSHDFVYTHRCWIPFSNDASGISCSYECRQCNARIWEIIEGNQPPPEGYENDQFFDPDDYFVPSRYGGYYLQGAKDLAPYMDSEGIILGDELPRLTPADIWPCPYPAAERVHKTAEPVGNSFDPNAWIDYWLENDD